MRVLTSPHSAWGEVTPNPALEFAAGPWSQTGQCAARQHFARHGFLTIVVGRHTPVLRAPIFFLAGASRLPVWKFLLADALSSAVTVPIVVTLGFYFGEHLDDIQAKIHHVQWIVLAAVVGGAVIWWLLRRRRSRRAGKSGDYVEARRSPGRRADPT